MVRGRGKDHGGGMDESTSGLGGTTHAAAGDDPGGQPGGAEPPRDGIDTDHLRDYRALRRSRTDRKLAGVAGGLARHLDIDPLLVRVVLVVMVFFSGAGLLLYGALWLLVPDEDGSTVLHSEDNTRNALIVIALVVAAIIAFSTGLGTDSGGAWFLWLLLIAALAWFLTRQQRRRDAAPAPTQAPPPPPGASGTSGAAATVPAPAHAGPVGSGPAPPTWQPAPARPRRRRGPLLLWPTLALIAVALGTLGLVDASGYDVPDAGYAALALAVTGAMLLVGSVFGRSGGLVLVALVSLLGLVSADVAEPTYSGSRDVVVTPAAATDLADDYSVPAGRIVLDLTEVGDRAELDGRAIRADVNAGEIQVIVPPGLSVDLEAEIRYGGSIEPPDGLTRDGWDVAVDQRYGAADDTVALDLSVGFGHINVRRG